MQGSTWGGSLGERYDVPAEGEKTLCTTSSSIFGLPLENANSDVTVVFFVQLSYDR